MIISNHFKRIILYTRHIALFSKDPFDRFNKGKNQPKTDQQSHKQQTINQKPKPKAQQINKAAPKDPEVDKIGKQRTRLEEIRMKKQRQMRQAQQKPIDETKKIDQGQNVNVDEQKVKGQNAEQKWSAFNRFKKPQKKGEINIEVKLTSKKTTQTKGSQNSHTKQRQGVKEEEQLQKDDKKTSYVKIDLKEQDSNEQSNTTVLRKNQKNKIKKENTQIQQQKKDELKEPSVLQSQNNNDEENNIWKQFEQIISDKKILNNKMMRIERKQLQELMKNKQKNTFFKPQAKLEPKDHRSMLIKGVAFGLFVVLLSSNQYFLWRQGTQRDAQQLTKMLQESRVIETWTQNIETETENDQHSKGKNYKKYIYVREQNGDISYCTSNAQFQNIWFNLVQSKNLAMDKMLGSKIVHDPYAQVNNKIVVGPNRESKKSNLLTDTRSIFSFILFYFFVKSILQMGKRSKTKGSMGNPFDSKKSHRFKQTINITFKDVVGMQKSKQEIVEFIDFLKFPAKYQKLGAKIPKGALLTGPPGTGKTMIAKACAGQSKVPFYTISGSQFIEMYVGVGAQRVRNLFKQAKQNAPSIIFIDEIDAVGKKRSGMGGGGNDERDTTLNQLLVEMDGFDVNTNVIVFAATNQKEVLDGALTRPGRFDRMIQIDLPDLQGRKQIFQVHLKPIILDQHILIDEYARRLATLTPGFSGADIKNVCNQAAIIAARNNKQFVSVMDFQLATQRIIGGVQKKSQLITEETRRVVAYHECGHGVVSWFIEHSNPLLKLTIIPRAKGALGFAQYLPNEHQMFTKAKLIDEICVILGGRVAQQVFFGKVSTGAGDDLKKAYDIAKKYVTQYGFGEKVGWLQYTQTQYAKDYSRQTENKIDQQISNIMQQCSKITKKIVGQKKHLIDELASKLLQLQTIDQRIIQGVLGQRPFKLSKQHEEYINQKKRMAEQISAQLKVNQKTEGRINYLL